VGCATAPVAVIEPAIAEHPAPAATAPLPEPDKSTFRVSIASVGDMMLGTDFPENHLPDDDGVTFLAAVTPWLVSVSDALCRALPCRWF